MLERNHNVFLNCPYDTAYKELFFATVYTTLACKLLLTDWPDLCEGAGLEAGSSTFRDMSHLILKWLQSRSYEGRT